MSETAHKQVVVYGATGRLGRELLALLSSSKGEPRLTLLAGLGRADELDAPQTIALLERADVVIDVSLPEATRSLLSALPALSAPPALLCGVTGLSSGDLELLRSYSAHAPTFYARNFSLGVALMTQLVTLSARVLGDEYDVELFELHHRQKQDAPSGTAYHLAEAAAEARAGEVSTGLNEHPRDPRLIHLSAGRGGQVVGEHTVYFLGQAERLELTHRARSRALFAEGALRATRWLLTQPHAPSRGVMGMEEMVSALLSSPAGTPASDGAERS